MNDRGSRLLQQLPLTVSPFIHLPTAVTLPYSYQTLPQSLPLASTAPPPGQQQQQGYITSPSGNLSTTPEAIIHSCHNLLQHLQSQRAMAEQTLKDWEGGIQKRELMEKRRVAPGYLDTGLRILEPTRKSNPATESPRHESGQAEREGRRGGEELDRVFGKMGMR